MRMILNVSIFCFVATFIANLAYWNGKKTEQFTYFPITGWARSILLICAWACIAASVMWLLRVVSLEIASVLAFVFFSSQQVYSIWFRWQQRHDAVGQQRATDD
jgi:hypothetical protein